MRASDYKVYKITYKFDRQVRKDILGAMDSEFSHYEKDQIGEFIAIAPTELLAEGSFKTRMGLAPNGNYTSIVQIIELHKINSICQIV